MRTDDVVLLEVRQRGVVHDEERVVVADPATMSLWQVITYVLRVPTNVYIIVASSLGFFFLSGLRTFGVLFVRGHFDVGQAVATRAVQDHERRSGARVTFGTQALPADVPLPVKIALYRALQESLSNATRHGRGQTLEVELTSRGGTRPGDPPGLELVVRDDGAGFDPDSLERSEGLGLAGIREQAEILGGSFAIRSAPGAGTELHVSWPLQVGTVEA